MERNFVDMLTNRFLIEKKKNDKSGIYAITQKNFAYHSNKIEGNTLSEKQNASLYDIGTLSANKEVIYVKDIEETDGHFMMFYEMLNTYKKPLSHELIKRYHLMLKSGVSEDRMITTLPDKVEEKITELLTIYNKKEKHTMKEIAEFHTMYETIQPFQDGRTGRMIIFKECLKSDIVPFILEATHKDLYYEACTSGNSSALTSLFQKEQIAYYDLAKDFVIPYVAHKELPTGGKQQ